MDACNRRGVTPEIKITIDVNTEDNQINVICEDNGEGMTEDILLNKFLCLGESGKRDNKGGTGGFGIAKAAIMSNLFWSVHTHDMYIDVNMLGQPLANVDYLDGTTVQCTIDESWYESSIRNAIRLVYMSDVSIHLVLRKNGEVVIDDMTAGLQKKILPDYKSENVTPPYEIGLVEDWNPGNHPYTDFQGLTVYRLNGNLVQFCNYGANRKTNVIVDIYSDSLPTDDDYPFSMSRESIGSILNWKINGKISDYDENPVTTANKIKNADRKEHKKRNKGLHIKGNSINGESSFDEVFFRELASIMPDMPDVDPKAAFENAIAKGITTSDISNNTELAKNIVSVKAQKG